MKAGLSLAAIQVAFALLLFFLPLDTAVQIGADEGYELAKAELSIKGYKMYTEVWNDQPPLHTFLITEILKHVSPSIAGPRLLSSGLAMLLLASFFFIALRLAGLMVATISTTFLLVAPIFLELGSSCMVEIPAMAPAVAAIALLLPSTEPVLLKVRKDSAGKKFENPLFAQVQNATGMPWVRIVIAGILLGISFQIKFINLILLPLISVVLWLQFRNNHGWLKRTVISLSCLGVACGATFFLINQFVDGQGFMVQFRQSWSAHFASARSFEYGSPDDHPFDWRILLRNWDTAVPAILGLIMILRSFRTNPVAVVAGLWLAVNLTVFAIHKPWWSCYYLHIAVPLSLCAGIGAAAVWKWSRSKPGWSRTVIIGFIGICISAWAIGRVYLELRSIRTCPKVYTSLFLEDIARYKPAVQFLYTEEPVYSFHTGIPMPPEFAVVALKRLWSGDMTNEKIARRLKEIKPGLMLLSNEGRVLPFNDLIASDYQMIYQDQDHRLFVERGLVKKLRQKSELF